MPHWVYAAWGVLLIALGVFWVTEGGAAAIAIGAVVVVFGLVFVIGSLFVRDRGSAPGAPSGRVGPGGRA